MAVPGVSRRRALSGVASVGLSLPLLSACGDDGGNASGGGDPTSDTSSPPPSSSEAPSSEPPSSEPPAGGGGAAGIAATGDVPVGGGVVVADEEVVVTQPAAGEFKVFTAVCTHSGCLVSEVADTINCPCHGSTYDISTGEPTGGPAPSALDAVPFQVDGDQIVLS